MVEAVDAGLKALAGKLAPTRDWDVFATETGAAVAEAFPHEQRLQRLLAAAERRRRVCHNELRDLPRQHRIPPPRDRACLPRRRPGLAAGTRRRERTNWRSPLGEFAARVLDKRLKRLTQIDGDIADMEPGALHAIRLHAKRLRYAAEIFAPLYPARRPQVASSAG